MCRWGGLLLVITGPTPPPLPTPHNVQPVRVEALCHTPPPLPPAPNTQPVRVEALCRTPPHPPPPPHDTQGEPEPAQQERGQEEEQLNSPTDPKRRASGGK